MRRSSQRWYPYWDLRDGGCVLNLQSGAPSRWRDPSNARRTALSFLVIFIDNNKIAGAGSETLWDDKKRCLRGVVIAEQVISIAENITQRISRRVFKRIHF